jgi:predicted Zn-dependent protease
MLPKREGLPAQVKDSSIDNRINPSNQEKSVIETVPLMNDAVKSLYVLAQQNYQQNHFKKAIAQLQRAYRIQANSPEITQLIAEINLHQGDAKQAHYWATISTKNSPAKGKICEKSWRILALAAELLGYDANQAMALEKKEQCVVKAPARY